MESEDLGDWRAFRIFQVMERGMAGMDGDGNKKNMMKNWK
jgi:hypothetical protein